MAQLSTIQTLNCLIDAMNTYSNNIIIYWKCILCLSAFPLQESIDILNNVIEECNNKLITEEALRSLKLIRSRK